MVKMVEGADQIARKLKALRDVAPKALRPELLKAGNEIAADARMLAQASRRTGALVGSVAVTGPDEVTPDYAADGGRRVAGEFEVLVTAGNSDARHAHLVEGGTAPRIRKDGTTTGRMPAAPFFNVAWRLNRRRLQARLNRIMRRAVKEATQ